jgi:hypothetical protein
MTVHRRWGLCVALLFVCQVLAASPAGATTPGDSIHGSTLRLVNGHKVGLGKVLSTSDGGQIFGWDINENGTDGVLATSQNVSQGYRVSVQTFDQTTAKITNTFAKDVGERNSYGVDGIFAGDIGLVTHYVVPPGTIYAKRRYAVMNPVTAEGFTGAWIPPAKDLDVIQNADNQTTSTSVVYGILLHHASKPVLAVADFAAGSSSLIRLNPNRFRLGTTMVAQNTATNQAVLAASGGAVGGPPPINALVDLDTGTVVKQWHGFNNGPFGAGFVNGLAVDSGTGIACTTTELNAQVEFYDLKSRSGTAVQLPGTGDADQLNSGAAVVNDPVHKLFLVTDPEYAPTGGGAIVVYKENGDLVEAITGFHFGGFAQGPTRVAVNPSRRMGWVDGPGIDQLQQFFY